MKFITWYFVWYFISFLNTWLESKRGKPYTEYATGVQFFAAILSFMIMVIIYNHFIK